jgi:hypothetical protein
MYLRIESYIAARLEATIIHEYTDTVKAVIINIG